MKKIINYKKYDTETATEIGAWSQGIAGTFEYVHESLFRKNNGEYFLHGEGGAASKYQEKIGTNLWRGGSVIIPLTPDEEGRFLSFEESLLKVNKNDRCNNEKSKIE